MTLTRKYLLILMGLAGWALVGSSWLQGIVGAPIILCWNLLTTNIAGHTKRSVSNGMWFLFYAAGNIAGANIFDEREAPRYFSALTGMIVCYCAVIVIAAFLWAYMAWENRRRDKLLDGSEQTVRGAEEQAILDGFKDRTVCDPMDIVHGRYLSYVLIFKPIVSRIPRMQASVTACECWVTGHRTSTTDWKDSVSGMLGEPIRSTRLELSALLRLRSDSSAPCLALRNDHYDSMR